MNQLEGGNECIKLGNGVGGGSGSKSLVSAAGSKVGLLNGLEKVSSSFLLFLGLGKEFGCTTGLIHEASEFVADLEPLLLLNVSWKLLQALAGFRQHSLLLFCVSGVSWLVKGVCSGRAVHRVGRVQRLALVSAVCCTFGERTAITDQSKDREARRFTRSGLCGGGDKGNAKRGSRGRDGLTTRSFLSSKIRNENLEEKG